VPTRQARVLAPHRATMAGESGVNPKIETLAEAGSSLNGEKRVSNKKRKVRQHSPEFKRIAVERMRSCQSVVGLAGELGINWRLLYKWKNELENTGVAPESTSASETRELAEENAQLKAALADQVMQTRFFKGALQRIEARRGSKNAPGNVASTNKCGK